MTLRWLRRGRILTSIIKRASNERNGRTRRCASKWIVNLPKIGLDLGTDSRVYTPLVIEAPTMRSELARLAGISTDTLRYYERLRLLPAAPRSAAGYRQFPAEALTRVRLIRGALAIGFSVRELAAIFAERDRGGAPCHRVRALAARKLAAVETCLRDLQSWRRELKSTLADWDRLLQKAPRG